MTLIPCFEKSARGVLVCSVFFLMLAHGMAADWPQWRYDAGRSAVSPEQLPAEMHLQWERHLPTPRPAWPESQRWLRFDVSYSPVAAEGLLFVPSSVTDSVTAYDLEQGNRRWRYYTEGPVRIAPIVHAGAVYFGSDDGFLYCVDAKDGTLRWRVRGGPMDRKVLASGRLISTWPIRGGPVLLDGTIYFSAGIWPFMGIFTSAVDASSGELIWTNSGQASTYNVHPHISEAFGGFVPRGHLVASEHGIIAPGGRTEPGCFDRLTGELRYFTFGMKQAGTHHVTASDEWYFAGGEMHRIDDGSLVSASSASLQDGRTLYSLYQNKLTAQSIETQSTRVKIAPLWKCSLAEKPGTLFMKAGSRLYAAKEGQVVAIDVDSKDASDQITWRGAFERTPWNLLAADGKLIVVTTAGRIYCYGKEKREPKVHRLEPAARPKTQQVATKGFFVLLGLGSKKVQEAMTQMTEMHVIAIDSDAAKVAAYRQKMDDAGLYGTQIVACVGDPTNFSLPPYLANLIYHNDTRWPIEAVFQILRPYGCVAYLSIPADELKQLANNAGLKSFKVIALSPEVSLLVREGALPGAADWTHHNADAANSVVSRDTRVKAPLGLLWYGGPSNDEVLPRHGHGPAPQVAGGRLVIEGLDMLRALDVYTGRLLWQRRLTGLGTFFNETGHQPGAGETGGNYVTLPDAVYVVYGDTILDLDPASGKTRRKWKLEPTAKSGPRNWGYLASWENLLVATSTPVVPGSSKETGLEKMFDPVRFASASRRLVVFDRHNGKKLWEREATFGFRHNNIALGGGKLFAIDGLSTAKRELLRRRGLSDKSYKPRLLALDVRTGKERWSTGENVFGTFLNYSNEHDVLLQAGSAARDRALDESEKGMVAYQGSDGKVIWKDLKRKSNGPCLLHRDTIFTQEGAFMLLTGRQKMRSHPLTGESLPWTFTRNYGCNTIVGSEHLLTFRSAAAGYFDLMRDGGTGNLGGFKSSCTSNLIVADGLLNAPEYTRTCTCNYQNQTSLALIHDPDVEMWTFNAIDWSGKPIRRVGINLGAPGDRRTDTGTLWLEHPVVGGPSPKVPVRIEPRGVRYFRHHPTRLRLSKDETHKPALRWVSASGAVGVRRLLVTLARENTTPRDYTVRLHFAETEGAAPGERVFDIALGGKPVLEAWDVAADVGPFVAAVQTFRGIQVSNTLEITLSAAKKSAAEPILCGVEIVAEGW